MMKVLYFEDKEAIEIGRRYIEVQLTEAKKRSGDDSLSLDQYIETLKLDPRYEFLLAVYLSEFLHDIESKDDIFASKNVTQQIMCSGLRNFLYNSTASVFHSYASKSNDPETYKKYDEWIGTKDHKEFIKYITKAGVIANIMDIAHLVFEKQVCDIILSDNIDKKKFELIRSDSTKLLDFATDTARSIGLYTD